ncbi:class I tRNA ligase family protein [Nocardioides convexus]|uniref:class I tRNA ligase family protein n=1 Tax=Nocardioides convexus TaxID=2712224 RepID=UPI0024186411|nr:class I tRNA ligase family protein [Nocardioides convexus]
MFPHHEMCAGHVQVATGEPFAKIYSHAGMVAYDGQKMSKSLGNLVFVSALRNSDIDPMAIRLTLLRHHYRTDWEWTDDQALDRGRRPRRLAPGARPRSRRAGGAGGRGGARRDRRRPRRTARDRRDRRLGRGHARHRRPRRHQRPGRRDDPAAGAGRSPRAQRLTRWALSRPRRAA